jgi:hypothetical protein
MTVCVCGCAAVALGRQALEGSALHAALGQEKLAALSSSLAQLQVGTALPHDLRSYLAAVVHHGQLGS